VEQGAWSYVLLTSQSLAKLYQSTARLAKAQPSCSPPPNAKFKPRLNRSRATRVTRWTE
jgi:hypothetical protein